MRATSVESELRSLANERRAVSSAWFFKTGKGEYGEGDVFLGLTVPAQRVVATKYASLPFGEVRKLLQSEIHELRFTALEILVMKYENGDISNRKKIVGFYLRNLKHINNWDLVDTSAPYILGDWLKDHSRAILYKLAKSKSLWDRRIAIVSTMAFINIHDFRDTFMISELLMNDRQDLIHKAVGWMLREVGKKSEEGLTRFLEKHCRTMPRTMLRYAIERFPDRKRQAFLKGMI